MTVDLATIGISMETSGLVKGRTELDRTTAAAGRTADAVDKSGKAVQGADRAYSSWASTLKTLALGAVIAQTASLADQYTKFTAQLKLATSSTESYKAALTEVQRISRLTQGGLEATGVLYARISNATAELGTTQREVAKITETVGLSLKVAGAGAQEAASTMLQLSQAFGAGRLNGQEFAAVAEAAPGLLKILAESIGANRGALKDLAEQGKLTTEVLTKAFTNGEVIAALREQAKQVQTISGAYQLLKDELVLFVGGQGEATGITKAFAQAIGLVARNLDTLTVAAVSFVGVKIATSLAGAASAALQAVAAYQAKTAATLAAAQADVTATAAAAAATAARVAELRAAVLAAEGAAALAVVTNGLVPAQARAAAAATAHAAALATLTGAQRAASITTTALGGALRVLGGPVGLITTILGIGATAWSIWAGASKDANDQAQASTETSTRDILRNLDAQNEKLRQRLALARQGDVAIARSGGEGAENLASILEKINKLRAKGNELTGVEKIDLVTLQGYYNDLSKSLTTNAGLQGEINGLSDQAKSKDWLAKYATDAEKLTNELAKAKKELGSAFTPEIEKRIRASFNKGAVKEFNKELSEQAKLLAELAGLSPDYLKDLSDLEAIRKKGNVTEAQYIAQVTELIAKQPSSIKLVKELAEAEKARIDAINESYAAELKRAEALQGTVEGLAEQNAALKNEIELIGLTERAQLAILQARNQAIILTKEATLAELERASAITGTQTRIEIALQEEIRLLRERGELLGQKLDRTESAKTYENLQAEGKRFAEDLERGLTDSLFRAFEAGKGFFSTLWDGIKNLFKTTVLKAIIQPVVGGITGALGLTGAANAATTGGGIGNLLNLGSNLSTAYSALTGSFITSIGSAATAAGNLFGSTAIAEFGLGLQGLALPSSTGALAAGGSTASALSSAAAAGPYVLAAVAALNALGVFRSRRIVDGGLQGTLGGQVNDFALERRGGTLFSGPDYRVLDRGLSAQNDELQKAYSAIRDTVAGMADQLGIGNEAIRAFTVQLGNDLIHPDTGGFGIKTQGLTQEQIIKKIEEALVSANDQLAAFALGTTEFSREGETASQTLARLAGSLSTANGAFKALGLALIDASVAGADAASKFIDLFGGVEQFNQVSASYLQNYFTEAERVALQTSQLSEQFAKLGLQLPTTRQGFRALVESQSKLGESALPTVAALLQLESAFASITKSADEAAQSAQEAAQIQAQLQQQQQEQIRAQTAELKAREEEVRALQSEVFTSAIVELRSGLTVANELLQSADAIAKAQLQSDQFIGGQKPSSSQEAARSFRQVLQVTNQFAEEFQRISNASPGLDKLFDKLFSGFLRISNTLSINGETSAPGRAVGLMGLAARADVSPAIGFKIAEELNASFRDFLAGGADLLRRELQNAFGTEGQAASRQGLLDAFGVTESDLASFGNDLQAKLTATVVRAAENSFDLAVGSYRYFVDQIDVLADDIRLAAEQTQTAEQKFSGLFKSFTDSLSRPLTAARGALDESIRAQDSLRQILDSGNVTVENRISLENQLAEASQRVISSQRQLENLGNFADPVIAAGRRLQGLIDAPAIAAGQRAIQGLGLSFQGAAVSSKILGTVFKDNAQSAYNAYILLTDALKDGAISASDYTKATFGIEKQFTQGARSLDEFKQLMQEIIDFRKSLETGPEALLSPEQQYQATLAAFRSANKENFVEASKALLEASKQFNAGGVGYFADLEAVKRRADSLTGGDGFLARAVEQYRAQNIQGFASGGYYPGGMALVGEQGPELINFRNPGQVYTASQTQSMMGGGDEIKELRTTMVNMGRMMQAMQARLIELTEEANNQRSEQVKSGRNAAQEQVS